MMKMHRIEPVQGYRVLTGAYAGGSYIYLFVFQSVYSFLALIQLLQEEIVVG